MDAGRLWVLEEVGRHLQRDDPLGHSCTAKGTWLLLRRQGQGCTKNPERTDVQEETLGETGRHHCNKGPTHETAATSRT
jgi:hypothetical protein